MVDHVNSSIAVGFYIRKVVHTTRRISRMTLRAGIEENKTISIIQNVRESSPKAE